MAGVFVGFWARMCASPVGIGHARGEKCTKLMINGGFNTPFNHSKDLKRVPRINGVGCPVNYLALNPKIISEKFLAKMYKTIWPFPTQL